MINFIKKLFRFLPYRRNLELEESFEFHDAPRQLSLQTMFYGLGLIILSFWILKTFKFFFIAITLSIFSSFMLLPIIHAVVQYTRLNRTFVSAAIAFMYTILLVFISWIILNNLLYFFSNLIIYESQLNNIINDIILKLDIVIGNIDDNILPNKDSALDPKFSIREYILNSISFSFYLNSANSFFTFISSALLVFIFLFFILSEAEKTNLKLKLIFKEKLQKSIYNNIDIISSKISRYLMLKMVISFATAFLVWLLLTYYHVENRLTWAFFTFAFNFIPNIGSIAITVLITLMSIIQFYPHWNEPIVIGVMTAGIQILIGNILDPKLQGDQLDLSPLLILISLAFWGYIWGVIGMFLAIPMLEVLRITCNNIKGLQPLAIFISSGRNLGLRYMSKDQYPKAADAATNATEDIRRDSMSPPFSDLD